MSSQLPYGEIFYPLLKSIHNALLYCVAFEKTYGRNKELAEDDTELENIFRPFEKWFAKGVNKHLSKGLSKRSKRDHIYSRLAKLTILSYKDSQKISTSPNFKGLTLPSPLAILLNALTVPSEPQSFAYSYLLCRSMLFSLFELHPKHEDGNDYEHLSEFEEKHILESIASFRNHIKIQLRWPDKRASDSSISARTNFLVGHILSLKGISHFWFSNESDLREFCTFDNRTSYTTLRDKYRKPKYRFRISDSFIDLPDPGEIINLLFGVPLPVRGADTLFLGGLKKTASGALVVSLSGKPGVGKTSIALSLAALLSPLNTKCLYISLEEEKEDLNRRLVTLIPEYLKELSIYRDVDDQNNKWFFPYKIERNVTIEQLTLILDKLRADLFQQIKGSDIKHTIPAVCPVYIVIDNINELAEGYVRNSIESYQQIENLIIECRKMGGIVFLISAEDVPDKLRLDYLVDVSILVKQAGTDTQFVKPTRIFQLNKTRHQISRQGSHVFHLTRAAGFRISPQIPSQMDKKENLKKLLPDKSKAIVTLNILEENDKPIEVISYLKIYPDSQILIHGMGSAGKAGLALKILHTPPIKRPSRYIKMSDYEETEWIKEYINSSDFSTYSHKRKVLVVSFLYPKEYYDELEDKKIVPALERIFKGIKNRKTTLLTFFPGYLSAEDFINKIIRHLDQAILEGEPFTGILLDGLHNVFLQFKNLQDNDMVWPLLYGILARYNLTVVSTFTNFRVNQHLDTNLSFLIEDQQIMQKGLTPLLHSMVKASDFYISLEETFEETAKPIYKIKIKSSVDQTPPPNILAWDRQKLSITEILPGNF